MPAAELPVVKISMVAGCNFSHGVRMSLSLVEIDPAFPLKDAGLGIVEIGPGYEVNGLGAYDNVSLVGALGQALDKPWYKKPLILASIAAGVAAAGTGAYLLYR